MQLVVTEIKYQSGSGYKFMSKEKFTKKYGAIHFNDTMTYRLTNKDKIEEIINSDDTIQCKILYLLNIGSYIKYQAIN